MNFQEIFNEHGMYVSNSFARGVCFEVRKDGTLLLVTYQHENDLHPTRENALMYKELFDKDYKKVFTKQHLFAQKPILQCFCRKCNKVVDMVNITGITDGEYMQATGYCQKHNDKPLRISGPKNNFKKYDIKIIGEEVFT